MTKDLGDRTRVTGAELDMLGVTKFKTQDGDISTFDYDGKEFTVQKLNLPIETYQILSKIPYEPTQPSA